MGLSLSIGASVEEPDTPIPQFLPLMLYHRNHPEAESSLSECEQMRYV
jgi:hypothetical protein